MNIAFLIILIIVGIALVVLLIAAFIKRDYAVEKQITINKPAREVFEYVRYLKNMECYNKWVMTDPSAKKTYQGNDGTVGAVYIWDSTNKQVGAGEQVISKLKDGERMEMHTTFFRPFEGKAKSYITTSAVGPDITLVTWGFASKMAYPMNFILLFINLGEVLGKDIKESLENLKQALEI
ncbi:MAG: SRPBCC family protein [Ferruginibacter sp.]